MGKDFHYASENELFTEFILVLSQTLKELGDDQFDIAHSPEAVRGDKEMIPVIRALPEVLKKHKGALNDLYQIYRKKRIDD
jgi:hypothetical protein